jgi:hypothetical protein
MNFTGKQLIELQINNSLLFCKNTTEQHRLSILQSLSTLRISFPSCAILQKKFIFAPL